MSFYAFYQRPDRLGEPTLQEPRKSNRSHLRTAAIVAGGGGLAYGGYKVARAAGKIEQAVGQIAPAATQAARNAAQFTHRVNIGRTKFLRRIFGFAAGDRARRREPSAVGTMAASAGLTGAGVAAAERAVTRGVPARAVWRAAGKWGGIGAAGGAASALLGDALLGRPKPGDKTAYTKRGAVGGAAGGTVAGAIGALVLRKRNFLRAHAGTNRVAHAITVSSRLKAAATGGAVGGAVGGWQGLDDGSGVDTIRNSRKRQFRSATGRPIQFEAPMTGKLAADRYRKKIADDDLDRGSANMGRGAAAGIVAGLLAKSRRLDALKRAAVGAAAGAGGVLAVRAATGGSKDLYGERSRTAKKAERLPQLAGLAAAGVLAHRRLKGAGGLRKAVGFSARPRTIAFRRDTEHHSENQARNEKGQFPDQLKAAILGKNDHKGNPIGLTDEMVVKNAWNRAKDYTKWGGRVGRLAADTVGGGRVDSRGRAKTPEYKKKWVGDLAATGAVLGGAFILKKNPKLRAEIVNSVRGGPTRTRLGGKLAETSRKVQAATPGFIDRLRKKATGWTDIDGKFSVRFVRPGTALHAFGVRAIRFDTTAPNWDVRDERGRSVRVFAPGAKARQRREKQWHERVDNIRRLGILGTVAGLTGGALLGYKLRGRGLKAVVKAAPRPNIVPFPGAAVS